MSKPVRIELTGDEGLVLLDLLTRINATSPLTLEDQAEQRVLWDLESMLERQVTDVFSGNYRERVQAAREAVRDTEA